MTNPSPSLTAPSHALGHLPTLRRMLAAARVRESFSIAASPPLHNSALAGLQASAAVLLAVGLVHLSPWAALQGYPALGALAALFGRFAPAGQRMRIVGIAALLLVASIALVSLLALAGMPQPVLLLGLGLLAGMLSLLVARWRIGGSGAVIFVFAASAALSPVADWRVFMERCVLAAVGAAVAWLICRATDSLRSNAAPPAPPAAPARPFSHALIAAGRIAGCAACAGLLAHAAGAAYPGWAAIGATAVLQGGHLHATMHRALQRIGGTVLGAAIAGLILSAHPSFWTVLLAVAALQVVTEVVIGFNYGLGLVAVTPMALLMTSLGSASAATAMPTARVLDTALGALVGLAFALLFSSLDDRAYLSHHHAQSRRG